MGCFRKKPCYLHWRNFYHPGRKEKKRCLMMSKEKKGEYVCTIDVKLSKGLYFEKKTLQLDVLYGEIDLKMFVSQRGGGGI